MKIIVLLTFICAFAVSCRAAFSERNVVNLIRSVPVEERRDFIKYALAKGYERDAGNKQEGIPEAFSNILRFYRTQNLTPAHMSQGLQEIVCFPWGCIDINDPSVYP
ncbi:unnamed protein product [Acanthoscelides obtectus]|uniref:Uncharacterized protein n=1 Tax=Acanthoscelides obtectus TaxID=200917 RepID=A0A9P0L2X5_ACAOB|nr:unnamed protein product [Acanthoscelides obtectus]CAK1652917.1 hypothetical protein AOBTE_LOCUS17968 [Acanthoscelides obtectus]